MGHVHVQTCGPITILVLPDVSTIPLATSPAIYSCCPTAAVLTGSAPAAPSFLNIHALSHPTLCCFRNLVDLCISGQTTDWTPPLRQPYFHPDYPDFTLDIELVERRRRFHQHLLIVATISAPSAQYPSGHYNNASDMPRVVGGELNGRKSMGDRRQQNAELRSASPKPSKWAGRPIMVPEDRMMEDRAMPDHRQRSSLPPPSSTKRIATSISPEMPPGTMRNGTSHTQGIDSRLQQHASSTSDRQSSRPLGVHSILNHPSQHDEDDRRRRRRSAAQMEEGTSYISTSEVTSPMSSTMSRPSSRGSDVYSATSPTDSQPPRLNGHPRRILTPLSPTMQRSASMGRIIPGPISTGTAPTGTIDAHQSPFLGDNKGPRVHMALPGAHGIPSLPSFPPPDVIHRYSLPPQSATPPILSHSQPDTRRPSVASSIHSARASPAPSFSMHTRSEQASPALSYSQYASSASVTPHLGRSPSLDPIRSMPPMSLDGESPLGTPGSMGNMSGYQLMTVDTANGPVQVPVEIQAASRMADEKRKRNAGASARFRARRKEKEKEASSRITDLETDLHNALADLDFFRKEREELLEALRTLPGGERYLSREKTPPIRPRNYEVQSPPLAPPPSAAPTQSSFGFDRPGEGERSTRRRTESYSLPPTPGILPPQSPGYFAAQSPYQRSVDVTRESTPMRGVAPSTASHSERPQPIHPSHHPQQLKSFTPTFDERWSTRSTGSQR